MEKISLSRFRALTHHKKINFVFTSADGAKIKSFESNKFYCNPYSEMLSMPHFLLSKSGEFYAVSDKEFLHKSEYGQTKFEIVSDMVDVSEEVKKLL
jgi:hypothetical protein